MLAAVDVGTNTVRLLLGTVSGGQVRPLRYLRKITRLGGGFHPSRGLSSAAGERTLLALGQFAEAIAESGAERVRAVGTAILRQAPDSAEFIERVRLETGLEIEVIDGDTEAGLAAAGVLSALEPVPERALIFDIGGGSTEFVLVAGRQPRFHLSLPLGVVRLCEVEGPDRQRQAAIEAQLDRLVARLATHPDGRLPWQADCPLIGTAGTVTTLAALELGMVDYDWRRVNNLVLGGDVVRRWLATLTDLSPARREQLPGMEPGRGDLILPGTEIVARLLRRFDKESLTVSDFGLLEGVLLSLPGPGTRQN